MITIFNRKELLLTRDLSVLSKIRDILSVNKIPYKYRFPAMTSVENTREYRIFVKKSDYDRAVFLIKDIFRT